MYAFMYTDNQILEMAKNIYESGVKPDDMVFQNTSEVSGNVHACALGAACMYLGHKIDRYEEAATILNRSNNWAYGVSCGFCGCNPHVFNNEEERQGRIFGHKARKLFLKGANSDDAI